MNYSTVKYKIIVCKKKFLKPFQTIVSKIIISTHFIVENARTRKSWDSNERKIEGRGGGEIRRRVFLANTWNTSREGKLWGQISFDISKCLEAVFPSATISTCMPWCHGILRYTREWVLLRFPSLQCRWFPPPLAILGAPQIHLTSYLTLGWKKITKSFRSKKFPFFWDTLYRVLHRYIAIYIYSYIIFFILSWKLFIWNWHFRFIHVSFSFGMENFNFLIT